MYADTEMKVAKHKSKDSAPSAVTARKGVKHAKYYVFGLVILVVLVLAAWGTAYIYKKQANAPKCSDRMLNDIALNLHNGDIAKLQPQVAKIQAIKNYTKDQNCVYVTMAYYIDRGDDLNARRSYNTFKGIYKQGTISSTLKLGQQPILPQIDQQITFLENIRKQAADNVHGQ